MCIVQRGAKFCIDFACILYCIVLPLTFLYSIDACSFKHQIRGRGFLFSSYFDLMQLNMQKKLVPDTQQKAPIKKSLAGTEKCSKRLVLQACQTLVMGTFIIMDRYITHLCYIHRWRNLDMHFYIFLNDVIIEISKLRQTNQSILISPTV